MDAPDARSGDPPLGVEWRQLPTCVTFRIYRALMGQNSQCKGLKPISSGQEPGMDEQWSTREALRMRQPWAITTTSVKTGRRDHRRVVKLHQTASSMRRTRYHNRWDRRTYSRASSTKLSQLRVRHFEKHGKLRWNFSLRTKPAQRKRLSPQKARYPKMKQAERKLEACVKITCTYQQWVQYALSLSKDILNTPWMLTTIVERMLSKLRWSQQTALN